MTIEKAKAETIQKVDIQPQLWHRKPDRKSVRFEFLKEIVMKQAIERGFGTRPNEVNVPEKILLIGSEVWEASLSVEKQKDRLTDINRQLVGREGYEFSWLAMTVSPSRTDCYTINSPERSNYKEEWGDALQRTLHLGGIFDVAFPAGYTSFRESLSPIYEIENRTAQFYGRILQAHDNYRHKRIDKFKSDLIWLAEYCGAVASDDGFDIEKTVLDKIETNKQRIWDTTKLNETLRKTE